YASISKLAQAGIIEGYGNGRFVGSANITRYEAAQIIAKALARADKADSDQKAQIERLAAEFAGELEILGVRVARLEKKLDNVTITGEARFGHKRETRKYSSGAVAIGLAAGAENRTDESLLRSRLWINGQVNERWKYTGMIEHNGQNFKTNANGSESRATLRNAWVEGSIGAVNVTAGNWSHTAVYGSLLDDDVDGLKLNYATGKWSVDVFALRPVQGANIVYNLPQFGVGSASNQRTQLLGAEVGYRFTDKLRGILAWYNVKNKGADGDYGLFKYSEVDNNVYEIGLDYQLADNLNLWAEYVGSTKNFDLYSYHYGFGTFLHHVVKKKGWAAGLTFGEKDLKKAGTFELRGAYYSLPAGAIFAPTIEMSIADQAFGYKGWTVGASYVLAKNVDLNVDYFDFKQQDDVDGLARTKGKLLWSYVTFHF
ncbi:MAG: S-layer homology domain-containing protein, partial [Acidaminococcales bacterium]|nr:S-layer homology domain-containing protein [Acidaminococcales bacterium]